MEFISGQKEIPMILPPERVFSDKLNVSRSTLLRAFNDLEKKRIIRVQNRSRLVLRKPKKEDFYEHIDEINSKTQNVENYILEKFAKMELKPGDRFSELQIAKEINANTVTVREVLLKISSTQLIQKNPRKQWEVISLTPDIIHQLYQYRELLETEGLRALLQKKDMPVEILRSYQQLAKKHQKQLENKEIRRDQIIALESEFHKGFVKHIGNRFMIDNYNSLFFLQEYHLGQRNMTQERYRAVLKEHLEVLDAIVRSDHSGAEKALKEHFKYSLEFFKKIN